MREVVFTEDSLTGISKKEIFIKISNNFVREVDGKIQFTNSSEHQLDYLAFLYSYLINLCSSCNLSNEDLTLSVIDPLPVLGLNPMVSINVFNVTLKSSNIVILDISVI